VSTRGERRRATFAAFAKERPSVLNFVEAAAQMADDRKGGPAAVSQAAAALAASDDPRAEFAAIRRAFFARLPLASGGNRPRPSSGAPVPSSAGGADAEAAAAPQVAAPPHDDDRRSLDELVAVVAVIDAATRQNAALADEAMGAAVDLGLLAARAGGGPLVGPLTLMGAKLRDASKAAGTRPGAAMMQARPAEREVDRAVARGADPEELAAVAKFSREYDVLNDTGHRVTMTRARFVELSMQRRREQKARR
jgi:hypothetical protein